MKKVLFLLIVIATCSSFQEKKTTQPKPATVKKKKAKKIVPAVKVKPTTAIIEEKKLTPVSDTSKLLPIAIQQKIDAYKKMGKNEQPNRVVEYEYKGQKVYYVSVHCCDFFNELYDSAGKLMGHPDGGFTGRGDKTLPDFNAEKKKERIIWTKE